MQGAEPADVKYGVRTRGFHQQQRKPCQQCLGGLHIADPQVFRVEFVIRNEVAVIARRAVRGAAGEAPVNLGEVAVVGKPDVGRNQNLNCAESNAHSQQEYLGPSRL